MGSKLIILLGLLLAVTLLVSSEIATARELAETENVVDPSSKEAEETDGAATGVVGSGGKTGRGHGGKGGGGHGGGGPGGHVSKRGGKGGVNPGGHGGVSSRIGGGGHGGGGRGGHGGDGPGGNGGN